MSGKQYSDEWLKYSIKDFGGGLNIGETETKPNELTIADNMELVTRGATVVRQGLRQCNSVDIGVTSMSSLFQLNRREAGDMATYLLGSYDDKIFSCDTPIDRLAITGSTDFTPPFTLTSSEFRWVSLANKAVVVSPDNLCMWTDGTNLHKLAIEKPNEPTLVTEGVTGNMKEGTYYVGYSYKRSGNFSYETSVSDSVAVTITADRTINMVVEASTETQIDEIRVFCSTNSGTILYWVKDIANASGLVNINVSSASSYDAPTNLVVPPMVKYSLVKSDRFVMANTNDDEIGSCVVRWSDKNQPDTIREDSFEVFDAEDGDFITGIASLLNYIIVFKANKIYLLDAQSLHLPQRGIIEISNKFGCIAPDSIQTVLGGRGVVYQSDEGLMLFDGKENISLSENRIDKIFEGTVNKTRWDDVKSVYYPTTKRYSISYPSGVAGNKWYSFYFNANGWTEWQIGNPDNFTVVKDESENTKILFTESTNIYEIDYGMTDNGVGINWKARTIAHKLHEEISSVTKVVRRAYVDWSCSGESVAQFGLLVDYGTKNGMVKTITHGGSTDWGVFEWGLSDWGLSGREIDRVNLSGTGKSFMFEMSGVTDNAIQIYNFNIHYYPISLGGVIDG